MQRRFPLIYAYLGAGLIVAMVAIVIITGLAAARQNRQSRDSQQVVAGFEAAEHVRDLQGQVRLMIYWQDAFENVVRKWNQKWVSYQFGPYQDTMGNHLVAILGPRREVRFLRAKGFEDEVTSGAFQRAKGLDTLLSVIAKARVRQPPPIPSGVIAIKGKPYFAVAGFVTPETDKDMAYARQNPYAVVFFIPVMASQFPELPSGFGATQLRIVPDGGMPERGFERFPLKDAAGTPIAWLEWKPHLPGDAFLNTIVLPLAAVLLLLAVIQGLVMLRWLALQRRLLRSEAKAASALEESRLKSVFLGTISHELRTPLNTIIGYSDVLCCQVFGPLGSTRNAEYVRDIRASGQRLLKIVNDLIEIARIEARDTGTDIGVFDVSAAARHAIDHIAERAALRPVTVTLNAREGEAWCLGSSLNLGRAFERILSNAIRHSRPGGSVEFDIRRDADRVIAEIRDHGVGIAEDNVGDLIKPFGFSENHLIATRKVAGFGLPIANGLVQLMGGSLSIDSELGTGTTVRVTLPAAEPAIQAPKHLEQPLPSMSGVIWTGRGRDYVGRFAGSQR